MAPKAKKRGKPRVKFTPAKQKKFLLLLSEIGRVDKCCVASGITRTTVYLLKRTNPKFEKAFIAAQDMAIALLEDEAWRRAFEGVDKLLFYKGAAMVDAKGKQYIEKQYSDTLLMNRLQAEMPDKYQYRQKVEHSGSLDLNINVEFVKPELDDTNS